MNPLSPEEIYNLQALCDQYHCNFETVLRYLTNPEFQKAQRKTESLQELQKFYNEARKILRNKDKPLKFEKKKTPRKKTVLDKLLEDRATLNLPSPFMESNLVAIRRKLGQAQQQPSAQEIFNTRSILPKEEELKRLRRKDA
jgi:hypothetical protein